MEYHAPSSLAAADGVLRRRSGVFPHVQQHDGAEDECSTSRSAGLQSTPTVLLVRRAPSSPPLPAFPWFASPSPSRSASSLVAARAASPVDTSEPDRAFSPAPLTPRPDGQQRAESNSASSRSFPASPRPDGPQRAQSDSASLQSLPRLPTPDFAHPPRFLSFFPRGLNFLSQPRSLFSRASSSDFDSDSDSYSDAKAPQSRPQSARSDSEGSSGSRGTDSSCNSVDSGHHALIKAVGTTDKFTHKWPRPQLLRNLDGDDGASLRLLEDGCWPGPGKAETWTGFKWCLLFSVCTVFAYGTAGLVSALTTWFRTWDQADVMYVADNDILILMTLAGSILVFTALVGLSGVFLNSRPILAVYTLLLWPAFASVVAIGYVAYKRATFSLDHKLNLSWSQYYTPLGRLLIQDSLRCCGFYSALHEATQSARCYPRTSLPGCKGKLYRFERANLALIWSTVFSLVPLHLLNVFVALLCANHVTETFGKGITPKRYRLTSSDVQADAEKIMRGVLGLDGRPSDRPLFLRASSSGEDKDKEQTDREDRIPFLSYEGQQY
ncbi:tetraspanin Tsp2 family [Mycena vulgaris]|nr:tetraspanin Tsp2 family [Mycena vulgaris]